jgi:GTP-binding protein EngB required for normal cell division
MKNTARQALNEHQKRHLRASSQEIERLLREAETILNTATSQSPFPAYRDDLTPAQRKVVQDYIARLRTQLVRVLESQQISLPQPDCGVSRALQANLIAIDIMIEELKPKYMKGYGALSEEATVDLNGIVRELQGLVAKLNLYLTQGSEQNLQSRLERLEQVGDHIELLKTLERVITTNGLVEFRPLLSTILDRLEHRHFEIALFGRVSSGKSSLLNYLLQQDLLPVGVNPITAVPTRMIYGKKTRLTVEFADRSVKQLDVGQLAEFVTEQQNPANAKQVVRVFVELPSPRLKQGLVFVDTPGLGSLATTAAEETLTYLPRCDLGIVLIDAGATLTQEDIVTLRSLYEAAIPAYVLLSKADLLTDHDREMALQYIADQITAQLGLHLPVFPGSVMPTHAPYLNRWLEQEVLPLLIERHQQLADQSIRRKIGSLREAVIARLQRRLGQTPERLVYSSSQRQSVEADLRQAIAQFETTRITCEQRIDEIGQLTSVAIARAASEIIDGWLSGRAKTLDPGDLIKSVLIQMSAAKATGLQAQLNTLAESLFQILTNLGQMLAAETLPTKEEFTYCIREMPPMDIATLHVGLRRSFLLLLNRQIVEYQIEKSLQQQIGNTVTEAFRAYKKLLQIWTVKTLSNLQHQFDNYADPYRVNLEQESGAVSSNESDKALLQQDLDRLTQWNTSNETSKISCDSKGVADKPIPTTTASEPTASSSPSQVPTPHAVSKDLILRFVSVADTGTGDRGQYAVAEAMTQHYRQNPFSSVILVGDNIYDDGEIEKIKAVFEQPYQGLLSKGVRFYACLSNHDIRTENGEPQIRYPNFNKGRYYTFHQDRVQFFALDTNSSAPWQAQLTWLEQELSRSDASWKIVFGHHPIYSSGHYGSNQSLKRDLVPLFQKYRVHLYISGHDHDYERTQAINGTTYITCGAGAGTRSIGSSKGTACSAAQLSFAAFEVYGDRIAIKGVDTNNHVFDQGMVQL